MGEDRCEKIVNPGVRVLYLMYVPGITDDTTYNIGFET